MSRLHGKTAVVTGSSRGIGRAIAHRLASEGAELVIHYASDADGADAVAARIQAEGGRAQTLQYALGEGNPEAAADEFWSEFAELKPGLDILVNNAGTAVGRGPIEEVSPGGLARLFAVNVVAPFFLTKRALPLLRDEGRIVNLSAHMTQGAAQPDLIAYAMTKGAVDVFTAALAKHLGPRQITVNAVAPGVVDTDMNASWLGYARDMVRGLSPLGRIAEPADVADVVAFLASNDSRWITGQHIDVSGGALL